MCSIFGGTKFNAFGLRVYQAAKDRGRDFSGMCQMGDLWIGNHRATPTNEAESGVENQPFGKDFKIVHNGTVANDAELGVKPGDIDSRAFELVLDVTDIGTVRDTLQKIKGSYAIAILKKNEIILACNYKPIFYISNAAGIFFSSLQHHLGPGALRVPPYSVFNLMTQDFVLLPREQPDRALVICSGGLDSTAVAGYANKMHQDLLLLHFDYGCRATEREREAIQKIAGFLHCYHQIVKMDYSLFKGASTLFGDKKITSGKAGVEYALDWVYGRNLLMLSTAVAFAEANKYGYIYLGTNLEEAGSYPDNEEQFIKDFDGLLYGAVNNGYKVTIRTPLGGLMKREIVTFGMDYDSPLHLSWSCYNGGKVHCGACGPCYMRRKAFQRAGVHDKTIYNDNN